MEERGNPKMGHVTGIFFVFMVGVVLAEGVDESGNVWTLDSGGCSRKIYCLGREIVNNGSSNVH